MFASFGFKNGVRYNSGKTLRRMAATAMFGASMLLSGCADAATISGEYSAPQAQARPDVIYVYAFDSAANEVQLDTGTMQKMKTRLTGTSAADQQSADAADVREGVATEIVQQLQAMGLRATLADAATPPPANQNVLMVTGKIDTIDAGSRRRRTLIGLGAGKSEVGSSVQVLYKPAGGTPQVAQRFDATADSGKMPGVAETAGVGAAVGHVATSAALGGGLHGASDAKRAGVSADAKRLGDSIAKQIAEAAVAQGWMPASSVKS